MNSVIVNLDQCRRIGRTIKDVRFKQTFQQHIYQCRASKESVLKAYLYFVGICHQTHSLISKKRNLKGWEYISTVFCELAEKDSDLLKPEFLLSKSEQELVEMFKVLFSDDGKPENCTLDRLNERVRFMVDMARAVKDHYEGQVSHLIELSDGYLVNSGKGLYELLSKIGAYSDPMKKKSTVFAGLAQSAGFFKIKDVENLLPPLDYHKQRLMLRTGCIEVKNPELRKKLLKKEPLASDEAVRTASAEALKSIIISSGHDLNHADYLLWAIGRSCCKITLLCVDRKCTRDPCTATLMADFEDHKTCLFEGICKGNADEEYRRYWQPVVDTHYY